MSNFKPNATGCLSDQSLRSLFFLWRVPLVQAVSSISDITLLAGAESSIFKFLKIWASTDISMKPTGSRHIAITAMCFARF